MERAAIPTGVRVKDEQPRGKHVVELDVAAVVNASAGEYPCDRGLLRPAIHRSNVVDLRQSARRRGRSYSA
ncbi:hypothetical protein [Mycobacterium decipiens]|uniref:Uncharacterized protein n=1 Tax=Mycobacterium decipiens TaxID=1430326 RepID=A0A1X2LM23_9MYCO|nr:hypothetical protein [Mycobacterium decipiens]OSC34821.1 hypothetical protein B8W66_23515 [Mycobacterium decipiens]